MRPTLRQMEYVIAIHQFSSFSLAAEFLHVSQPSLSNQITAIEAELGVRLFQRSRSSVVTTSKGIEFVSRARRILAEVTALRAAVTSSMPFGGRLRLGVLPSIGPYLLPVAVQRLHRDQPDLRVVVREENTLALDEGISNGRFDAIISTPEDHPNTSQIFLFQEKLWAAVSNDHPLAKNTSIAASDLNGQRLLTLDTGHRLARIVYSIASQSGAMVSNDYEGTSLDSILLMAAAGAGVAIIPDLFARRQAANREEVRVIPLDIDEADRAICMIFPFTTKPDDGPAILANALTEAARSYGYHPANGVHDKG